MTAWDAYKKTMIEPATLAGAAKRNDVAELGRLLDAGADLERGDARGYTALMHAAYAGHREAFDLLLARGADPNTRDLAGSSVLMAVAFKGHADIARRLLDAGADPSVKNEAGLDARGFALAFGRMEIVALLDERKGETQ